MDDPLELRPQVRVRAAVTADDVRRPFLGLVEDLEEVRPELGEDRDLAGRLPLVVLGLRRTDAQPVPFPVHVRPLERQVLGRATQAAVAAEGKEQAPLGVGAAERPCGYRAMR